MRSCTAEFDKMQIPPVQAFFFGLDFRGTLLWIANGALFDVAHAIGNLAACALVLPLTQILHRLERR